jgi:hypothetical protein
MTIAGDSGICTTVQPSGERLFERSGPRSRTQIKKSTVTEVILSVR